MSSPPADEENTPVVTATAVDATLCERGILRSDLGNKPVMVKCGHCSHTGMTNTKSQMGACTFGSAFALLFLFFPLIWLPFVVPSVSSLSTHNFIYVWRAVPSRNSFWFSTELITTGMFSAKTPNIIVRIVENFSVYAMLNVAKKFWGPPPQLCN
jgi:hypothetical protein